ncbi:hypothetical protein PanWU01x14_370890, partial [Parasponia andersonii]
MKARNTILRETQPLPSPNPSAATKIRPLRRQKPSKGNAPPLDSPLSKPSP